jgi:uncharacterized sulfatase
LVVFGEQVLIMKQYRAHLTALLMLFCTGCFHPVEIIGQGDVVASDPAYSCTFEQQSCSTEITGAYQVTYTAVPRSGWRFVGWENCGHQFPDCAFNTPANFVALFAGQTMPTLRAVFEPVAVQYNIALIVADDLSFDHYSYVGHPLVQTPSLDALAAESVRYPNAYVSSTCRPTFATLLTGRPEHAHGVTYISGPPLYPALTLAHRLENSGYETFQAGKFWEGNPMSRGFSGFVPFNSSVGNLNIGRTTIQPVFDFVSQAVSPWFIWFTPLMPHSPHTPPASFTALYQGLGLSPAEIDYYAMISWFDDIVGQFVQGLPADTVVVYLADNGYLQSTTPEVYLPNSKVSLDEHGIRTELLIRHPDHGVQVITDLASAEDVVSTILAVAGGLRSDLPGRNLLAGPPATNEVFGSRWTLGVGAPPQGTLIERWGRSGDWKLIDSETGPDRLYDLVADPDETQNLHGLSQWSAIQQALQQALDAWW